MSRDYCSRMNYFPDLLRFNQKRLEKCKIEESQLYQPKPVAVETIPT